MKNITARYSNGTSKDISFSEMCELLKMSKLMIERMTFDQINKLKSAYSLGVEFSKSQSK